MHKTITTFKLTYLYSAYLCFIRPYFIPISALFFIGCPAFASASQEVKASSQSKLVIVTEHLPPLQVVDKGVAVGGMSVEIVKQMLAIAQDQSEEKVVIQGLNWARAYKMAKEQPNVMIFSITRNHIREKQFHWVGMIDKLDSHLWRLRTRTDIKIDNLENAKNYTVAVPKGDIQHQILKSHGFKESEKMVVVSRYSQALKMLLIGRVDLIIGNTMVLKDKLSPLGHNFEQIKPVIEIRNNIGDIYIAFSLTTPIEQVKKYQNALKLIKRNGIVQRIIDKYEHHER